MSVPVPKHLTVICEQLAEVATVRVAGELDVACEDYLERVLRPLEEHASRIVLDLTALAFIDSTGLRLLLGAAERARNAGVHLEILAGTGHVRRTLELTGLHRVLPIADDNRVST